MYSERHEFGGVLTEEVIEAIHSESLALTEEE
jgi:hypothetical protein